MTLIFGIDPGLSGAIAVLRMPGTVLLDVQPMPTLSEKIGGKDRRRVSGDAVRGLFVHWAEFPGTKLVTIERVSAMPKQGVTSMFSFGRAVGVVEGVVAALALPREWVSPRTWQKAVGLTNKDNGRTLATERFPNFAKQFSRVADEGKADAALIALYGSLTLNLNSEGGPRDDAGTLGDEFGTVI